MTELASPATRALAEPLATWAERCIRLDGRPFSFQGHDYLRALYDDPAPHVVVQKAAQIGGTVWALLRAFKACLDGLSVGYYFPTKTDVLDFSKSRVAPLIDDNPFLRQAVADTDTVGLKRIGSGHIYFRGMLSQVGMKSIPLDLLVFDELDEASPDAKAMARERLAHSDYKRIIELSNPSLPDYGVDAAFQDSDQRHWTIRCSGCGDWTCLDKEFPRKLGQEVKVIIPRADGTCYRACAACGGELDVSQGEWVPDFPGRPIHGYRISQLHSLKMDPGEILREYRTTRYPDRFYNLKIGIPWADREQRLDPGQVLALCGEEPMAEASERWCSMGVDTGRELHVVILEPIEGNPERRLIRLAVCYSFEELDRYIEKFKVTRCVIDGLPETHATREFARRHRGVVLMNFFSEHQRGAPKADLSSQQIVVNRTEALDASRAAVREGQVVLPRQERLVETFATHMAADAKVLDEDPETGIKKYRYIRTGADHFSLAFTYAWLAANDCSGHRGLLEWYREQCVKRRKHA